MCSTFYNNKLRSHGCNLGNILLISLSLPINNLLLLLLLILLLLLAPFLMPLPLSRASHQQPQQQMP